MIKQIVAVKDRAMDAFLQPFFVPALGGAIRAFGDEINNPQSEMQKHPEDYDLYHLGEFNDNTGEIKQLERPLQIAIGKQMKGA